eukprot:764154-Hanusia_phi.AAC.1
MPVARAPQTNVAKIWNLRNFTAIKSLSGHDEKVVHSCPRYELEWCWGGATMTCWQCLLRPHVQGLDDRRVRDGRRSDGASARGWDVLILKCEVDPRSLKAQQLLGLIGDVAAVGGVEALEAGTASHDLHDALVVDLVGLRDSQTLEHAAC